MTLNSEGGTCPSGCPTWMCAPHELSGGEYDPCPPDDDEEPQTA